MGYYLSAYKHTLTKQAKQYKYQFAKHSKLINSPVVSSNMHWVHALTKWINLLTPKMLLARSMWWNCTKGRYRFYAELDILSTIHLSYRETSSDNDRSVCEVLENGTWGVGRLVLYGIDYNTHTLVGRCLLSQQKRLGEYTEWRCLRPHCNSMYL